MMPSDGTASSLSGSSMSRLLSIVEHSIEKVQVYFVRLSTVVSSGSTGMGLPAGTGSVLYLSCSVCLPSDTALLGDVVGADVAGVSSGLTSRLGSTSATAKFRILVFSPVTDAEHSGVFSSDL